MSNNIKSIIVFIEPNDELDKPNWKAANLYLNRFTIDEDSAFELLGVYELGKYTYELYYDKCLEPPDELRVQRKEKVTVTNSKDISILELE